MPQFEKRKTRSPLKEPSLPQAGESATVRLWELIGEVLVLTLPPFGVFCIGIMEWMHYIFKSKPQPLVPTIGFVVVSGIALWKGRRTWRNIEALGLGIRGERAVGEMLEKLRAHGYHVFHDLVEDGYNIDHVLIGPGGVFSVETKTHSKPESGDPRVVVEGRKVTIDGFTPDRDPIVQAEASARRVRAILLAQTGREMACEPVVIYPGWFVENRNGPPAVVVMNEKYFVKWLPDQSKRITPNDVAFLAAGMERYLKEKREA